MTATAPDLATQPASHQATGPATSSGSIPSTPAASPSAVTATTVVTPSAVPSARGGGLPAVRLTYPGIKKLVIVHSYLNDTAAGRAALNTVAAYNSLLVTVPTLKTVAPLRALSGAGCATCNGDLKNDEGIIAQGQNFSTSTGVLRFLTVALFIEYQTAAGFTVRSDVTLPAYDLVNSRGHRLQHFDAGLRTSEYVVATTGSGSTVQSYFDTPK